MDYTSILDMPPLSSIAISAFQTFTLYIIVLAGLKLVGRRVFAEQMPQDLIILLIIAEACDLGLTDERAGYWGTVTSVITILFMGWLCDKVPFLRRSIDGKAVTLYKNGRLNRKALDKFMMEEEELDVTAREYGLSSYKSFESIILEGEGKITGVISMPGVRKKR